MKRTLIYTASALVLFLWGITSPRTVLLVALLGPLVAGAIALKRKWGV